MANTKTKSSASTPLVPRFVHTLNALAKKSGLAVDTDTCAPKSSEPWPWDGDSDRLLAVWRGTAKQLRETGIFPKSYRFPMGARGHFRFSRLRRGRLFKEGRYWKVEVDCGEIPSRIERRGGVEIAYYGENTAYHGTGDDLLAGKFCAKKHLASGKRTNRGGGSWNGKREWSTQRLHDGTFLHRLENEDVFKARVAGEAARYANHKKDYERQAPSERPGRDSVHSGAASWGKRLSGCCALLTQVESEILDKMQKEKIFKDSSKLGRALEDLDMARSGISSVTSEMSGGGRQPDEDDD
jgi:hypothetical protein